MQTISCPCTQSMHSETEIQSSGFSFFRGGGGGGGGGGQGGGGGHLPPPWKFLALPLKICDGNIL